MATRVLCRILLAGGMFTALAAGGCDGGGNLAGNGDGNGAGAGDGTVQDNFGAPFAAFFNAEANSDPGNPVAGDVPALSLTTDPLNF